MNSVELDQDPRFWEYSRWVSECRIPLSSLTDIVVISPGHELDEAWPKVQELFDHGAPGVWVVGHGVVLAEVDLARHKTQPILLTELGLLAADQQPAYNAREDLHEYFSRICRKAGCPEYLPILVNGAANRFLYQAHGQVPYVAGLRRLASRRTLHFLTDDWEAIKLFHRDETTGAWWKLRLGLLTLTGVVASVARALFDSWRRRGLVKSLSQRRDEGKRHQPEYWLVVHNEWPALNPHLVDAVALPWLARGHSLGVLLSGELLPGTRNHFTLKRMDSAYFSGLGALTEHKGMLRMDQIVVPEGVLPTLKAWYRTVATSVGLYRAFLDEPYWTNGNVTIAVARRVKEFARMLSIDVARARSAEAAVRQALKRNDLKGRTVFTGAYNFSSDCELQRHGCLTVDYYHGSCLEAQIPVLHCVSSRCTVWTESDALMLRRQGHTVLAGVLPRRHSWRERVRSQPPWNLLVCTSYVHRDYKNSEGCYKLLPFHYELARLFNLLQVRFPGQFRVRWRPHPADSPAEVQNALASLEHRPELSSESLAEDVQWADGVIASFSSVILETLLAGVPTFLHVLPMYAETSFVKNFDPARQFFTISELAEKLHDCFLDGAEPNRDAERENLRRLLGGRELPGGLDDILEWLQGTQ